MRDKRKTPPTEVEGVQTFYVNGSNDPIVGVVRGAIVIEEDFENDAVHLQVETTDGNIVTIRLSSINGSYSENDNGKAA